MSKLKFCLAGEYPIDTSRIGGGALHVMYLLGETFAERNDIDFHIVASAKGIDGVKVVERPGMTIHYIGQPKRVIVPNLLTQTGRIVPVLRDLKPDVINSHHHVTTEAAIQAGCKVVHTIHGITHREVIYTHGKNKMALLLQSYLQRKVLRRSDGVISVAQYGLDAYAHWIKGPAAVINVPIEDVFWNVAPLDNSRGVIFAGGIGHRKNLRALIHALPIVIRKHPDMVLYVCGGVNDQSYKDDLDRYIAKSNISNNVKFLGVVDRYKLVELLGKSISLVLPSYQETSPGVVCQAMAAGRVPIASPVGGVPEMIEDGVTGFLVDADDSDMLAQRLIELFDDFDKAKKMGSAARTVALKRYNRHDVADRILQICSSVISKNELPLAV